MSERKIEQNAIEACIGLMAAMMVTEKVKEVVRDAPVPAGTKVAALSLYVSAVSLSLAADLGVPLEDVQKLLLAVALSPQQGAGL